MQNVVLRDTKRMETKGINLFHESYRNEFDKFIEKEREIVVFIEASDQ
jgi:hypothetical protein